MTDIDKAILILKDAVRLTLDEHLDQSDIFNNLRSSLLRCFESLGDIGDIEKAI
jgi:hypothetical protein